MGSADADESFRKGMKTHWAAEPLMSVTLEDGGTQSLYSWLLCRTLSTGQRSLLSWVWRRPKRGSELLLQGGLPGYVRGGSCEKVVALMRPMPRICSPEGQEHKALLEKADAILKGKGEDHQQPAGNQYTPMKNKLDFAKGDTVRRRQCSIWYSLLYTLNILA
jgi:hypothetical protein